MDRSVKIIGKNIKEIRDSLGLTQKEFSALGNISPATLVNIESTKKNFRIKSLEKISSITGITLKDLTDENFISNKNLKEKLLKKYKDNLEIFAILNTTPSIDYIIKQKLLPSGFLDTPKEISEIQKHLLKIKLSFKNNSIHVALKRLEKEIKIKPHSNKKGTFVYSKK